MSSSCRSLEAERGGEGVILGLGLGLGLALWLGVGFGLGLGLGLELGRRELIFQA